MKRENVIVKRFLGESYLKYTSEFLPKLYKFRNWLFNNEVDLDYEDQFGYSDKLEFDFVYFNDEDSVIVFIKKQDERKFLEFLSTI